MRNVVAAVLLSTVCSGARADERSSGSAVASARAGYDAFEAGSYQDAARAYGAAIAIEDRAPWRSKLTLALIHAGQCEAALQHASKLPPADGGYAAARCLAERGLFADAAARLAPYAAAHSDEREVELFQKDLDAAKAGLAKPAEVRARAEARHYATKAEALITDAWGAGVATRKHPEREQRPVCAFTDTKYVGKEGARPMVDAFLARALELDPKSYLAHYYRACLALEDASHDLANEAWPELRAKIEAGANLVADYQRSAGTEKDEPLDRILQTFRAWRSRLPKSSASRR
jgi:thioredoxin-like negative regulator of GroEL